MPFLSIVLTSGAGAGTGWFTFTATGTFSFAPLAGGDVTYSGRFTIWDGENINLQNYAATVTQIITARVQTVRPSTSTKSHT